MNEIRALIKEFGSYSKLAKVMGITKPALSNMQLRGLERVPPKYNALIMAHARMHMLQDQMQRVEALLDHSCPTCGRPY